MFIAQVRTQLLELVGTPDRLHKSRAFTKILPLAWKQ